jgi:hypothetical protein
LPHAHIETTLDAVGAARGGLDRDAAVRDLMHIVETEK